MRFNPYQQQQFLPAPFGQNLGDMYHAMLRQNTMRGFPQQPFAGRPEQMQPFAGRPERMQPFAGMPFPGAASPPPFAGGMYPGAPMQGGFGGMPMFQQGGNPGGMFGPGAGNRSPVWGGGGFSASPGLPDPEPYQPVEPYPQIPSPLGGDSMMVSDDPYGGGGFDVSGGFMDPESQRGGRGGGGGGFGPISGGNTGFASNPFPEYSF